jgi:hypothetical protein
MTLIATATAGAGGVAGLGFDAIPSTFTDLMLIGGYRTAFSQVAQYLEPTFNFSSASFTSKNLYGTGSSTGTNSGVTNTQSSNAATSTSNTFSNFVMYIPNYTSSNNKSFSFDSVVENNAVSSWQSLMAGLWSNTASIYHVQLGGAGQTVVQFSTVSLYGITKGSGGATVS